MMMEKLCTVSNKVLYYNIILFIVFLFWNYLQPFTADDYSYILDNVISRHVLFDTLQHRYETWSGRVFADGLAYYFLNQGTLKYLLFLINVLNSFALVVVLNLIYKFNYGSVFKDEKNNFIFCSLLYIVCFGLVHNFSQDFLWKTVTIQYAWGFALLLFIFRRFYLSLIAETKPKFSWISIIFYLLSGVFLGFYNEVYIALVLSVYLSTIIVWYLFKQSWMKLFQFRYIVFLLALIVSGLVSITAPGNFVRRSTYLLNAHITPDSYGFIGKIFMTYVRFFRYGYHVVLAFILLYIGVWIFKHRNKLLSSDVKYLTFLFVLLNIHIMSFVGVAYYSPVSGRMLIGIDTIIFCLIFKFVLIRCKLNNFAFSMKRNYGIYITTGLAFFIISVAYYDLHCFILRKQAYIMSNQFVPQQSINYTGNILFRYIVYFDSGRTFESDFIKLYKETGIN